MVLRSDAREVAALAADLPSLPPRMVKPIDGVFKSGAEAIEKTWRENAEETAGAHGKHYPKSIDHERLLGTSLAFEIGPNPAKKQGRMSFEMGSRNQPPHLDGQKAADVEVPRVERNIQTALTFLGL